MDIQIIKCFIASPSDTQNERHNCDKVINDINRDLGDILQI